jgi:hypothetical protein
MVRVLSLTLAALDLASLLRSQAVPLDQIPTLKFQFAGFDFGKLLDPTVLLNPLEELAGQLIVVSRSLAFIMLVWSTVSRLSGHRHEEFWPTILRSVVLVAVMGLGNQLIYLADNEVNAIVQMPIHVTASDGSTLADTLGTTPKMIGQQWSKIFGEVQNPVPQQSQGNGIVGMIPGVNEVSGLWNEAKNITWNIIHAIWRGAQLLAMIFLSGLYVLQRVLLIAGGVYYPIAIGQMGSRTLRNTGLNFLLSYLGLFAWPIGWGIVNLGVLAAIATNPARTNVTTEDLVRSLVMGLPVVLWIILGYVLAPFCIQKIVAKGGAAIQPFLSSSIMGSLAAAMVAKGMLADRLFGGSGAGGNDRNAQESGYGKGGGLPLLPWAGGGGSRRSGSSNGESGAPGGSGGTRGGNTSRGGFGGVLGALGSFADTIGELSAEASGEPDGMTPRRLLRSVGDRGSRGMSSSDRARRYLQ